MSLVPSRTKPTKRDKQSILPKPKKTYNGSKPIPGKHKVIFPKASELDIYDDHL